MADDYKTYLEERFQGEVFGEAAMQSMAEACADPGHARKLRVLAQLERETKELLLPAVIEAGGVGEASPERVEKGLEIGAKMGTAAWLDVLQGLQSEIPPLVEAFERAEALAPAGMEALFRHVTDHERALLEFAKRELANADSEDSLAPVLALLKDPPRDA